MNPATPAAGPGTWTLVVADQIHTLAGPPVKALVLLDDRVAAVGDPHELHERFRPDRTIEVDGVLVPGFNDAHAHPSMTAENLLHVNCSPEVAPDEDVLVRLLREEAAAIDEGQWVVGSRYDHTKTTGGRVLDREFLDRAVPDHPVLLTHVAAHWGVLNSAGLAAAGLTDASTDPPGGVLGRNASGALNGVVYEQALFDISYPSLARAASDSRATSSGPHSASTIEVIPAAWNSCWARARPRSRAAGVDGGTTVPPRASDG
jgi:predicted amidohydrolase YtcJ